MIYPLSFGSWLTCPRPIRQTSPEVKGYGWLLERRLGSGREKEEKQSCGVYWAAVEATCRVDILAGYANTSGGGQLQYCL